ncbi:hypothetical protein ACFVIM_11310 [Streptomyces sp. NPDC057638]|uniref:hypothetical protein n=1 Tax=Streptomyces sp. NPDC057638 TaxID=3346190 RepID=UPI003698D5F6
MRADRQGLRLSLVASAAALALAAPAAPALASAPAAQDDPSPVGVGMTQTDPGQRGVFTTRTWTTSPGNATVVSASARIRQGDTVVAELPALASLGQGRFTVPTDQPLKLTEDGGTMPAIGRYAIDVTATDSAGATTTKRSAGVLDFTLRPALTLTVPAASYDDPHARPHGRLTGIQPGSGDQVALTGRTVELLQRHDRGTTLRTVTTAENGDFAEAVPLPGPTGDFTASFAEASVQVNGKAKTTTKVTAAPARQVTLTADADRTRVRPGEKATVTGQARFGDAPAAGVELRVELVRERPYPDWDTEPVPGSTVTTDAEGRFTATLPGVSDPRFQGFTARVTSPYLTGESTAKPLAHPSEARIDGVTGTLGADRTVTLTGTFGPRYPSPLHRDHPFPLLLEHSANGTTGWKTLSTTRKEMWAYGLPFTVTGKAPAGGHFRVRHAGGDHYTDTVGTTVALHRAETRIASVNATPEPVRKGATLTVTGIAGEKTGTTWKALPDKRVQLWFLPNGSTTWSRVGYDTTDAVGRASFTTTAQRDGTWIIRYYAGTQDTARFDSVATGDYVDVR